MDFDGDGQPDLAVANAEAADFPNLYSSVSVLQNTAPNYLKHTTSTALSSAPNPTGGGAGVQLTATVTSDFGVSGAVHGDVTFYDGKTVLGTTLLTNGQATLSTSFTTTGVHLVEAAYAGSTAYGPSRSPILRETVGTLVTLNASQNPAQSTQTLTLIATVNGGNAKGGTVTFIDDNTVLGTMPLACCADTRPAHDNRLL